MTGWSKMFTPLKGCTTKHLVRLIPVVFHWQLLTTIPVRPVENKSAPEIIAQLQHAQNDLEDLACHVTAFADWWGIQVVGLRSLVHAIPQIQMDGLNPLRKVEVRRRWERIIDQYLTYSSKVVPFVSEDPLTHDKGL